MPSVVVVPYDPAWPERFLARRQLIAPALDDLALAIEHVGSTSVPGLAAKPIIDIDVVVPAEGDAVATAIARLATLGYVHRGDLGIAGREAFSAPDGLPAHHLYVCPEHSLPLRNHLALRDHLRANPDAARAYGALKADLARRFPDDIDSYIEQKSGFILAILAANGLDAAQLDAIRAQNLPPATT